MPSFGVNVAIIQEDRVLLTQRSDLPVWCLPGGAVEEGESLAEAAVREAREETGLEVVLTRLVGVYSRPHWWDGGCHEILFAARPVGGTLCRATTETVDARYCRLDELPDTLLTWHYVRAVDALGGATGVARSMEVPTPLGLHTRRELYALRDRGELPLAALASEFCGPPRPDADRLEVDSSQDGRA